MSAAIAATKAEAASALEARLAEHEAARSSALDEAVSAARAEAAAARAVAVAEAFAQERQADLASMERLLDGLRSIGGARTLTEVLETLTTAVEREAGRAALLLLRQNRLRGWRLSGFEGAVRPEAIDLPAEDAGLATQAIRTRAGATTRETTGAARLAAAVPFADLPADRVGLAIPVEVGGQIVAVVYADDAVAGAQPPVPSPWPEAVEMLVRHAARSIEALTLRRAHGLQLVASAGAPVESPLRAVVSAAPATAGAAAAARVPPASAPAPGPARPAPQAPVVEHDDEAARRYARLLVSEIKLYLRSGRERRPPARRPARASPPGDCARAAAVPRNGFRPRSGHAATTSIRSWCGRWPMAIHVCRDRVT